MSLINCPECGKEISSAAKMCPECGRPISSTQVTPTRVVTGRRESENQIPPWMIATLAVFGVLILFGLIYFLQSERVPNENVDVNLPRDSSAETRINVPQTTTDSTISRPETTTVDPSNDPVNDQTINDSSGSQIADTASEKGTVEIKAQVADAKGNVTSVDAEKFYLLDKELGQILREAKLKPINNLDLVNSFGLSVLDPDKYSDFNGKALNAINDHIKYDTLTNKQGLGQISNIEPESYFLFGVHKVGKGFAIWSSPVLIKAGKNRLEIKPQKMNEY